MKKILIMVLSLFLVFCLSTGVFAAVVTTTPQESTSKTASQGGYEDGLIHEADITLPITACFIAVGAVIAYGVVKIKKSGKDDK